MPRLLNYIVANYLVIIRLLDLSGGEYPASAVTERRFERRTENTVRRIRSLMRSSGCNRAVVSPRDDGAPLAEDIAASALASKWNAAG